MTSALKYYARNEEEIAADVVEGEAVIINLANGSYYSLDRAGTVVWELLGQPQHQGVIAQALASRYGIALEQAQADGANFLEALIREQLVVERQAPQASDTTARQESRTGELSEYQPPRLTKYTDMADMLALDPPLPGFKDLPWKTQ